MRISDREFIAAWKQLQSPALVAKHFGINVRAIYARRARLADRGTVLPTAEGGTSPKVYTDAKIEKFERAREFDIINGHVVIFSDPHFYPDHNEKPLKDLCALIRDLKPKAVICGGDALDGTQISRFDPTRGWHAPPPVREQIECMQESLNEVKKAAGKGCITAMTLGNHDARFSRYLAVHASHMEDMPGTRLEDFIPAWPLSWTVRLNKNTVIRHRNQPGMLHLQAQKAGCHYLHGHVHKLNVHATAQYYGFLYSVDCGSFADPTSDAFDYAEDDKPHVQGYAVLTYKARELLWPELAYIKQGTTYFRGGSL
jgi:UDP-2,3-diacylglucosamine pyrophosphatase LpxH